MDDSIKRLHRTTFSGRRFTRQQLVEVQQTVDRFARLSRNELAQTICEHLDWRTDGGVNSAYACLKMLEELQAAGVLRLPGKDETKVRGARKRLELSERSEPGAAVVASLSELSPIALQLVECEADKSQWNELVDRYHYLGYRQPMGCHLRYFIVDKDHRRLGCLLFQQASRKLPCRDEWIGWQPVRYKKRLKQVVQNARFLILPWVQVSNLASKALSLAARRVADDWQTRWGVRPVLMESFVDKARFSASSYRAAGWQRIGETVKRSDKTIKDVYVKPLADDARRILLEGEAKKPRRVAPRRPSASPADDRFVRMWRDFVGIAAEVAEQYDRRWQQRRRVLNTLLIMLFVFRLVFSKNHQGYQTTVNELWDQSRLLGVELPQPQPPVASSMCVARHKLDEQVFKTVYRQVLARLDEHLGEDARREWCGRRLLAVDGTKINLPRALLEAGYSLPSQGCYYPQGLVSCLYRLGDRMPMDFELLSHLDEHQPALGHLKWCRAGEVVVYDRGYYSFELLRQHAIRGIDCIFRLKRGSAGAFDEFIDGCEDERVIEVVPSEARARQWRRRHPGETLHPIRVRCVRYSAGGNDYCLATTLLDQNQFPLAALSDAYHGRWGIEELYKVSKRLMEIEQFHAKSERGVKQELYAHFVLLALSRSFGNQLEDDLNTGAVCDQPKMRANFKNVLVTVARNFEALMLGHWQLASTAVSNILNSIGNCLQKERPGRSYPRVSKRPDERFRNANRRTRAA